VSLKSRFVDLSFNRRVGRPRSATMSTSLPRRRFVPRMMRSSSLLNRLTRPLSRLLRATSWEDHADFIKSSSSSKFEVSADPRVQQRGFGGDERATDLLPDSELHICHWDHGRNLSTSTSIRVPNSVSVGHEALPLRSEINRQHSTESASAAFCFHVRASGVANTPGCLWEPA
jgi:hypothetical protein